MQFRVMLSGKDFLLEGRSGVRRVGFFATRTVAAASREEAGRLAVERACSDLEQRQHVGARLEYPSRLSLERVEELGGEMWSGRDEETHFTFFLQDD